MRLTSRHFFEAAIVCGVALSALAAFFVIDSLVGYDSFARPAVVSALVIAVWIFLLRRYGPRRAIDPRRLRIQFLSSAAAAAAVAASGVIAVAWIEPAHPIATAHCPAASQTPCHPAMGADVRQH